MTETQANPPESDRVVEALIPVNRTGWSIASGYLGLFSVLPFIGIVAIIISCIAFYDFKRRPNRHGRGRAVFGLVMGILTTFTCTPFWIGLFNSASAANS